MNYFSGYDLGQKIAGNVKASAFPLRTASFIAGITEALEGGESRLSPEEVQQVIEAFKQLNPQAAGNKDQEALIAKHRKEGEEFLAANKAKDSVRSTPSGLQYKILREGTGRTPADTSLVTVHYRGRLINGTVFDESYGRGEPTSFRLNQVIRGWTEGVQLIREGGMIELYIPSMLAYGEQGAGQLIPPGATLIFTVELISVQ
ncbi:MAG: FKBP-type peptidyl-prolyl cis-trans isomerase [Bacteroidetes bacterium]|nr:FKBP-type peptidyl-prolyl cis-trans isomerase [Bacteroidota bacterium]